jgi:hypothetical protein
MTSKLIKDLQQKIFLKSTNMMEFIEWLLFLNVDYIWCIIFYQVIIQKVPYEQAGVPFGVSKHAIYERLKSIRGRIDDANPSAN